MYFSAKLVSKENREREKLEAEREKDMCKQLEERDQRISRLHDQLDRFSDPSKHQLKKSDSVPNT